MKKFHDGWPVVPVGIIFALACLLLVWPWKALAPVVFVTVARKATTFKVEIGGTATHRMNAGKPTTPPAHVVIYGRTFVAIPESDGLGTLSSLYP